MMPIHVIGEDDENIGLGGGRCRRCDCRRKKCDPTMKAETREAMEAEFVCVGKQRVSLVDE
jgi:hypothetical protein